MLIVIERIDKGRRLEDMIFFLVGRQAIEIVKELFYFLDCFAARHKTFDEGDLTFDERFKANEAFKMGEVVPAGKCERLFYLVQYCLEVVHKRCPGQY